VRAAVAALVDAAAGRPVRTLTLAVGTGVDLASAATAWQAEAAGTCMEHCHVRWQRSPDRLRCFSCAHEYDGESLEKCPLCGSSGIVITRAPELTAVDWTT